MIKWYDFPSALNAMYGVFSSGICLRSKAHSMTVIGSTAPDRRQLTVTVTADSDSDSDLGPAAGELRAYSLR
ncbi:unnamed protein product [Nezara viridula]|uniref:Uncharacterized protein n=1 Tax=Nezara viridula TaxID=85310 RepID=A0A9P0HLB1_NEZVI|nr:unnamed protein product [Nezara viridula]